MACTRDTTRRFLATIATVPILVACVDSETTRPRATSSRIGEYVTARAAASLGPDQHFNLASSRSLNGQPIISASQAKRLGMAFVRRFGQSYHEAWERDRGASIDLTVLTISPRIYFAQTPYGKLPRDDIHPSYRRTFGPYYLLTFEARGVPVIVMAVSALATDYSVDQRGQLTAPTNTGMDFIHEGIPVRGDFVGEISPEEAAQLAAEASGSLVSEVPELVLPGADDSPTFARWKVELDRDVPATRRSDHSARRIREVYVSARRNARFEVAHDQASQGKTMRMLRNSKAPGIDMVTVQVPVNAGRVGAFEPVDLSKPEN